MTILNLTRMTILQSDENEDRVVCGLIYPYDGGFWIGCDGCNDWFDLKVYQE